MENWSRMDLKSKQRSESLGLHENTQDLDRTSLSMARTAQPARAIVASASKQRETHRRVVGFEGEGLRLQGYGNRHRTISV
jgi:hypothetical protein